MHVYTHKTHLLRPSRQVQQRRQQLGWGRQQQRAPKRAGDDAGEGQMVEFTQFGGGREEEEVVCCLGVEGLFHLFGFVMVLGGVG